MSIKSLLTELTTAYASAALDCGDGLFLPANDEAIHQIEVQLGLSLPVELWDLLRIHGGQNYITPGVTGLFGQHRLHSPQEIIEHHRMFSTYCLFDPLPEFPPKTSNDGYWVPTLIPFASWDAYDLCIHSERGDVWEFCPNIGLTLHRPSISVVLQELLSAVNSSEKPKLIEY